MADQLVVSGRKLLSVAVSLYIFFVRFYVVSSLSVAEIQQKAWHLSSLSLIESSAEVEPLFNAFISTYNRSYSKSGSLANLRLPEGEENHSFDEYRYRLSVFQESLKRHTKLNDFEKKHNGSAKYGVNRFSDMTPEEFQGLLRPTKTLSSFLDNKEEEDKLKASQNDFCYHLSNVSSEAIPTSVDWRNGHVTSVKDQMKCGSCWAFTATQQVESYWSLAGHALEKFSVQELISCSSKTGCLGGNTCYVLHWLAAARTVGGEKVHMVPAVEYPYEDRESQCRYGDVKRIGATISAVCGCTSLVGHEPVMSLWMADKGPLGVSVNAVSWHNYVGGIIQHHCTGRVLNHAVQLVGYNMADPVPYWIVKNSWGPSFGEDGYLRIKFGDNLCGVATEPSYIII